MTIKLDKLRTKIKYVNKDLYNVVVNRYYPYDKLYLHYSVTVPNKLLTQKWFIFYEIFNLYDIININEENIIHINAKMKKYNKIIKHCVDIYCNNHNIKFTISTEINNPPNSLIILDTKQLDENLSLIEKYKKNVIMRMPANLTDEHIINNLFKVLLKYKNIYFHKSEIDTNNRIHIILMNYETSNDKNINTLGYAFASVYDKIITHMMHEEITKLYMINRYNSIEQDKNSITLIKKIKRNVVKKYIQTFMV